jgi:hypothetical protein
MTGPEHPAPAAVHRRERIRRIRQSVAAIAAATFIALFAVIYVQMAAGRDPALGATTTAPQSSSTTSGSNGASSNFATNGSGSSASDHPATVTTGQS